MKKKLIFLFVLISCSFFGQQKLQFKINGLSDTTVFLARYFGEKLYYADTTVSKNEVVIFNKKEFVGGIYAVVCPNSKYFEFIVADENVEMETDINDFNGKMKVIKSENNKIFFNYIRFLGSMKEKMMSISSEKQQEKREELDVLVKNYQKENILANNNLLGAKVLAMSIDPEIPESINENDSLRYRYYLDHYWDHIDVTR